MLLSLFGLLVSSSSRCCIEVSRSLSTPGLSYDVREAMICPGRSRGLCRFNDFHVGPVGMVLSRGLLTFLFIHRVVLRSPPLDARAGVCQAVVICPSMTCRHVVRPWTFLRLPFKFAVFVFRRVVLRSSHFDVRAVMKVVSHLSL